MLTLLRRAFLSKLPAASYATEAKFPTKPYKLHLLEAGPASESLLTRQEALDIFRKMTTIRKMEAMANVLYKSKQLRGFCHLYSGEEAVAVGIFSQMQSQDLALTSYRCHAWAYLFYDEDPLVKVMGELMGLDCGCSGGKGGSMHMYAPRFLGGNAIVGAQVPMGAGLALALKYSGKKACSVTLYGDGASNSGQVFETYNMAKLWDLPCVFVCENNQYSMGTSVPRSTANAEFFRRGAVIPGIWVDGMDIFAMREAAKFALAHCREGKGPIILEAHTYRYFGHSLSDPGTSYRSRDEVSMVRKTKDPINLFKDQIVAAGLVTEEELKEMDKSIKKEVDDSVEKAKKCKIPGVETIAHEVYSNDIIKEIRNVSPFHPLKHLTSGKALQLK